MADQFPNDTEAHPNDTLNLLAAKIVKLLREGAGGGGGGGGLTDAQLRATPVAVLPSQAGGALTNRSGNIASGGTSQVLAVVNPARKYLIVQNISVEPLYLNFDAAATIDTDSLKLLPGGSYESPANFVPTDSVNILGATTGSKFIAFEG